MPPWIDAAYDAADVAGVLAALDAAGPDAAAAAATIRTRSATSVAVTLRALREAAASASLEATLDREYRIACAFLATPDYVEGIRAVVVDKDRRPRWAPAEHGSLTAQDVERFFAPRPGDELGLDAVYA